MSTINERVLEIIEMKADGNQKKFADMFGWKPQYVQKMVSEGGSVGLSPVKQILDRFLDINARWLITGEGERLDREVMINMRIGLYDQVKRLLEVEKYIPYMTYEELQAYKSSLATNQPLQVESQQLEKWQRLAEELQHH